MQKNGMNISQRGKQVNSVKGRKKFLYLATLLMISMTGCFQVKEQSNLYAQCLNKIWIRTDIQIEESPEKNFSFIIKELEEDYVEGHYMIHRNIINLKKESLCYFTGYIKDSQIKCQLWNENNEVGSMVIEYISDDKLQVYIEYSDDVEEKELHSESIFKIYNIEDLKETDIILDYNRAVTTELDRQGKVQLLPGLMLIRKAYPVVFMINEQGDILYEFNANFINGCRIEEFDIMDMNGDGLKDIDIITYFGDTESFHWLFYQNEDGSFSHEKSWYGE